MIYGAGVGSSKRANETAPERHARHSHRGVRFVSLEMRDGRHPHAHSALLLRHRRDATYLDGRCGLPAAQRLLQRARGAGQAPE